MINHVNNFLGDSDKFQGSFRGTIENTFGHLVLTNKRLMFLRDSDKFEMKLDILYPNLKIEEIERNLLRITDKTNGKVVDMQTAMMAKFVVININKQIDV